VAEVSPLVLDRLAQAHHYAFTRIQEAALAAVTALWLELTTNSLTDEERWLAGLWAVIEGSARVSSYEAAAYLQAQLDYTGIAPRLPAPDLSWLREDFDAWAVTPIREATARLAAEPDVAYEVIVRETVPVVRKLTDTVLRTVEVRSIDALVSSEAFAASTTFVGTRPEEQFRPLTTGEARALADRLNGKKLTKQYMRVTQAGACGWCQVVASRLYSHGATLRGEGWHDRCRCTWREVTPDEAATWSNPLAGDWQDVIKERAEVPETGDGE
jgi:hypothetical protein